MTTPLHVWFLTDSGNAEMAAEDLADSLGVPSSNLHDLADSTPAEFDPQSRHLVLTSTHGEGQLPESGHDFVAALESLSNTALAGVTYGLYGLGDSSYTATYSRGGDLLAELLDSRGARRIGEIGRHDAHSDVSLSDDVIAWGHEVVA